MTKEKKKTKILFTKHYKKLITLLIIAILAFTYVYLDMFKEEEVIIEDDLSLVAKSTPKVQDMSARTTILGEVDPTDQRVVVPELSGEVETIYVEEGDYVNEGDLLMQLDAGDYHLQLEEAIASYDGAKAQLEDAKKGARSAEKIEAKTSVERAREAKEQMERELERVENLHEQGYASGQELEQVELQYINAKEQLEAAKAYKDTVEKGARDEELDALRSQVRRAETGVDLARRMLDRTQITAPADGEIAMVGAEEGELVGTSEPAFVMLDTTSFQVVGALPEVYVNYVFEGDEAKVEIPSANEISFTGIINHVGQLPPEDGSGYPVEIDLEPEIEEKVRAGMYSQIDLTIDKSENALSVPRESVIEHNDTKGVYIVEDNQIKFVDITTGLSEDGYIEITSGVSKDDYVVFEGMDNVYPGDEVETVEMGDRS
ncbi:efflux RND transporter periplasmic adaptor subunit [Natranaerobius trueperi]|uniref:Uncharacterized protein n=1 Tax=Natranaerobius trueperi TaxID=759412 RepID=A0A226BW44_9FIRM|nr:efflux RND transporter periplasmic adaptor subunit [Natranaerobius trueperi]OWZ83002.1 hypothetical protein CDO51_10910 [Natranaerobius trueperi]